MDISPQTQPQADSSPLSITDPSHPDNPANNVNLPVAGWPSLARFVGQNSELEAFPTFSDLAIKSLLYYQAELVYLRKALHKVEWRDFRRPNTETSSHFADGVKWLFAARDKAIEAEHQAKLGQAERDPAELPEVPEQWILIEKIRTTLKKYSELFSHTHRNLD
jgi:hypothetical protein